MPGHVPAEAPAAALPIAVPLMATPPVTVPPPGRHGAWGRGAAAPRPRAA